MLILRGIRKLWTSFKSNNHVMSSVEQYSSSMVKEMNDNIIWIDLEMTGLDVERDKILEISCLVSDSDLNIISEELNIVIHQPDNVLNNMNEWCMVQHEKSGLINESKRSRVSVKEAEKTVLTLLQKYTEKQKCPLAGNSVYMDRYFLLKHMPVLANYLHYRIIDVSSFKEIARRWNVETYRGCFSKANNHRAANDIKESIRELSYYRNNLILCKKDI